MFGSCIIHILYTGVLKLKKIIPAPKVNNNDGYQLGWHIDKEVSIRKMLAVKNDVEQRNLGSFAQNSRCKLEKEAKKAQLRLTGEGRMRLCVGVKGYRQHR